MSRSNFFSAITGPSQQGRRNYLKEEEIIVQRRNAELNRRHFWTGVNSYFQTWENRADQFSKWSSPEFYRFRDEESIKKQKKENLEKRRLLLLELLTKEDLAFQDQIKLQNSKKNKSNCTTIRNLNLELIRKSDETSRREKELRLYHNNTFPNFDHFRKQHSSYFSAKHTDSKTADDFDSALNKTDPKSIVEKENIVSNIMQLSEKVKKYIDELDQLEKKKNELEINGENRLVCVNEIKSDFNILKISDIHLTDRFSDNSLERSLNKYVNLWIEKSKNVQNELKHQVQFIEKIICFANLVDDNCFKIEMENIKRRLLTKLRLEIGRESHSNILLSCRKDPEVWWKQENQIINEDIKQRKELIENVFSKLETLEENYKEKSDIERNEIIVAQNSLLAKLEIVREQIEQNEKKVSQWH